MTKIKKPIRKEITDQKDTVSVYELTGTLKSIRNLINHWIEQHGEDAVLDYSNYGFEQYNNDPGYRIYINRPETDEEYAKSCEGYVQQMVEIERKERVEFERLQKKFGVKTM